MAAFAPKGQMSTRGTNFLHEWIANNLDRVESADIISVADLVQKLFADAKAAGIASTELEEDGGSIYQVVLEAILYRSGGRVEGHLQSGGSDRRLG